MNNLEEALLKLNNQGYRSSASRNLILSLLAKSCKPLAVLDFQKLFKKNKLNVNRTTLYRELDILKKEGLVSEIQLKDSKKWYELANQTHHHHVICTKCGKIDNVVVCDVKLADKILKLMPGFSSIDSHTFVFFGLCKSCAHIK
jgi:Fe2+ or Zn2+ uptake regulation protein